MVILRAANLESELDVINDFCHDALVEREALTFEPDLRRLTVKIEREAVSLSHRRARFFGHRRTRMRSRIIIRNVIDLYCAMKDVEDDIISVKYASNEGVLTFEFVRGSELRAKLNQFEVELVDDEIM